MAQLRSWCARSPHCGRPMSSAGASPPPWMVRTCCCWSYSICYMPFPYCMFITAGFQTERLAGQRCCLMKDASMPTRKGRRQG